MLNFALPTWAAPQTTGHPFGLPNPSAQPYITTQIAPLRKTSDSALGDSGGRPFGSDTPQADDHKDPEQPMAPPSALQLKIISILQEQADALSKEKGTEPKIMARDGSDPTKPEPQLQQTVEASEPTPPNPEVADPQHRRAYDDALRNMAPDPKVSETLYLPSSANNERV